KIHRVRHMRNKNGGSFRTRRYVAINLLLNRDDALHVQREMRNTVERILTRLDLGKRDRNRFSIGRLHVAGKLAHLVRAHVCIELGLYIGRNRCRVERDVVRSATQDYELDSIALLDGDVGWLEAIALGITDHVNGLGRARNRSHCNGAAGRTTSGCRSGTAGGRCRCRCRGACVDRDVRRIARLLLSACAGAERYCSNCNRKSVEPHLWWPPRAVQWCTCKSNFQTSEIVNLFTSSPRCNQSRTFVVMIRALMFDHAR